MLSPAASASAEPDAAGHEPRAVARYGVALAATAAALALSIVLRDFGAQTLFIFFFAAVVGAAWYGGRGPALLATALSVPLAALFLLDGFAAADLLRLALFAGVSLLVGAMRESLAHARRAAERHAGEAEHAAALAQDQAAELEVQAAELAQQREEAQALAAELDEASRRLRDSMERQLAQAERLAGLGSWEWSVADGRLRWSEGMFRVYGLEPGAEEPAYETFLARVHPDDRARVSEAVARAVETLEPFEFHHRIVLPGGAVRTLHARGTVEAGPDGRAARMTGTGQDVTDQRAADDAARRLAAERAARAEAEVGRARLEAVLESIGDAFVALDREWRYTYVNRRAEEALGRPRGEVLGRVLWEVLPHPPPEAEAVLRRVMETREPGELEYDAAGRRLVLRAHATDQGVSVFHHDVTERHRARRQLAWLASIVESSQDAIFSKTLEGVVESWNASAERLYGYTAEEIVGLPVSLLAPPERADEIPRILSRISRGERIDSFETVRRRKDGTRLDVMLTISPLLDGAGRIVGASTIARDVTERKRHLAMLAEGEARYRRLLDTANEGIWLLDTAGRTSYVNGRLAEMLGYGAEEMLGLPFTAFVHPEARAELADHLARRRGGSPETRDFRLRRKDGGDVWALVALSAVTDGEGAMAGALAMVTDVTERRRAEASVRFLSEASRVLAASLDYRATLASVVRLAVPALADLCTVSLAGPDGAALPVEVAHADPAKERLVWALARRVPAGGATLRARVLVAGEPLLVEEVPEGALEATAEDEEARREIAALGIRSLIVVPLKVEGGIIGLIALCAGESGRRYGPADLALAEELARRAATAVENARLHEAEQRARREAEAGAERIARLQAVTGALSEARTPAEVADVVIGEGLRSMGARAGWLVQVSEDGGGFEVLRAQGYDEAVVETFRRTQLDAPVPLADALRTGEPVFVESPEARAARYPGLARDYARLGDGAWAAVPMTVEGRVIGGIGLSFATPRAFDADERGFLLALARQSAQALERARLFEAERRARAEAEAANRAKFQFLTTMSHELRTPLNAIAGYVELLDLGIRGPVTEAQRADLERIRRSQTHLLGLINDVLNFARIEGGHVHFDVRDVPLDEALLEAEALIRPQVDGKGLVYEYRRADAALAARVDAEKLRQIVLNLLSNAVKFTPAGGRVTLEAEALDGTGTVAVRVRDTGIGIPPDKLPTIFEPFVQVNAGYTRTSEGTGLGLSISRDLARLMGGELAVESREGEGSVFTLVLPRGAEGSA